MKVKELYLPSGYLNIPAIMNTGNPFKYLIGARGIGKTYGVLEYLTLNKIRFLYIRRRQTQVELIAKPEFNPYKKLNSDKGWQIAPYTISKYNSAFYYQITNDDGKWIPVKEKLYGYVGSLSTFSSLRGFDASDVEVIFYDEFVPERTEPSMRGEAEAFFNMIETVGRNRELAGEKPLIVICASNSTDCSNPLFVALKLVTKAYKMKEKKIEYYEDKKRGIDLIIPAHSPISEAKKETSLYKLTEGTEFYGSAIENEFVYNTPTSVKSRDLRQYIPLVVVGEICIYKSKDNKRLYVSHHLSGSPPVYGTGEKELAIFRKRYQTLSLYVFRENIDYEDYICEILFDRYYNMVYN